MNVAVCINHVPDTAAKIIIAESGDAIDEKGISFVLNPYDEFAIEEALRLKDKSGAKIFVLSVGNESNKESIRKALALGADEGILLKTSKGPDPYSIAKLLAVQIKALECPIVFTGKQSVDYDDGIVGQMLSEFLGYNCVSNCCAFSLDGNGIIAEREIEGGREKIATSLPAVITTEKGLNEPRYASMKGILAAKKKMITEIECTVNERTVKFIGLRPAPSKTAGKIVGSDITAARELAQLLHNEAKII